MICVVVLGGPRAGTSAVAGVLHRLGVHMGDALGRACPEWNPTGFHEDEEFSDIYSRMVCGTGRGSIEDYMPPFAALTDDLREWHTRAIVARCEAGRPWGVKSARLCYVLPEFVAACPVPVKAVRCVREESASVASWQARTGVSGEAALETIRNAAVATDAALAAAGLTPLVVAYEDVVLDPAAATAKLAEFVGLPVTPDAVAHLEPLLRRY